MTSEAPKIRVLLVDDQKTIHEDIGAVLADLADIEVIAHGYNGREAVQLCAKHLPDVILMDVSMPEMNGIQASQWIAPRYPQTRIIAMTGLDDADVIQRMVAAGAAGYVLKEAHPDELASIIRTVYAGKAVFSANVLQSLLETTASRPPSSSDFGLTRREMDILRAMSEGLNNNEVAEKLSISTATVRFHLINIIEKLGAANRTEALIMAARHKLI